MRFLVRVTLPHQTVNDAMRQGKFASMVKTMMGELKPEAAYFTEMDGYRTAILIVQMEKASEMPRIAEPFFLGLEAEVEFHPVMSAEDLAEAGPYIEAAVKSYS